jgi:transcriptional regulator with XRE-family HTH domain
MTVDAKKVGEQIYLLRKIKGLTQNELGERLSISAQAVSKWERGETLPDTAILSDLADILETSVDNILRGGERQMNFKRKITVAEVREGIACFEKIGELLGKDSYFYLGAIEGVDKKMNIELEKYLSESYTREAMIAEALVQCIMNGAYVDPSDVKKGFEQEHWSNCVLSFCEKHGIK